MLPIMRATFILPPLVSGFSLLLFTCLAPAQGPVFAEVEPVYNTASATWGRFPALKNMRSAWGDVDADGDPDVIIMGEGTAGPVTKLFLNDPSSAATPFAFGEVVTPLPQLQDGALAWGDMDNDGDLDLAISGSVRANPTSQADLRVYVLRNEFVPSGNVRFTDIKAGSVLQAGYGGCASWADINNDGDQDLFLSGRLRRAAPGEPETAFAHMYENSGGILSLSSPHRFLSYSGANAERRWQWGQPRGRDTALHPEAGDVDEIRRVTWVDVNKDSFPDMVTSYVQLVGDLIGNFKGTCQDIWVNTGPAGGGVFERWGDERAIVPNPDYNPAIHPVSARFLIIDLNPVLEISPALSLVPEPVRDVYVGSRIGGGVGDWDGDGWTDLAFTGEIIGRDLGQYVLHRLTTGAPLPQDLLPGFSTHANGGPDDGEWVCMQTSADLMNTGRQQWLCSLMNSHFSAFLRLLSDDANSGLGVYNVQLIHGVPLGLESRFGGVLDAVDVNGDGRLDVLHSGHTDIDPGNLVTRFYRNQLPIVNTPPTVPGGLTARATPTHVNFSWSPSADAKTPAVALRYAIKLRRDGGNYRIRPGATDAGRRLVPGLNGTLQTTDFVFRPGAALADGTYCWSVQAVDSGGMGSAFAPEQSFIIGDPLNPPPPDTGERSADIPWRDAAMDAGDFDNDGDLDLALAGRSAGGNAATLIRRNDGPHPTEANSFAFSATPDLPSLESSAVRWGDVDGDGDLDLAVSGRSQGQPVTRVYRNRAGVMEIRNLLEGVESSALDWGDFDNDGDLDLIVTGYRDRQPVTRLYRNGPGEQLTVQPATLPDLGNGAAAWGDFDHDGDLDLLLCGDTQNYAVPSPVCTLPPYHLRPPGASYMCLVTSGPEPKAQTTLFRNDGLAQGGIHAGAWRFTPVPVSPALPPLFSYSGQHAVTARVEWGDMTGDGVPDLLVGGMTTVAGYAGYGVPTARVLLNSGPGNMPGEWIFQQGEELLADFFDDSMQTLTFADWTQDGWPDVLLGGWLNGPGTIPLQVRRGNGGRYFPAEPLYLRTTLTGGEQQFAGGPAIFGHFNGDANLDVALNGRYGIVGPAGQGNHGTAGRIFLDLPTPANLRPTPPPDLTATASAGNTEFTFSWGESSDGLSPVKPTYNLHIARVDGQPGGMPGMADLATGQRRVARRGNVGHHRTWKLSNLPAGEYRWSVQAIDVALATSAFTTAAQNFTAAPPVSPVINPLPALHQWVVGNPRPIAVDLLSAAAARNARLLAGRRGRLLLSRNRDPFAEVESGVFTDLHEALITQEGGTVVGDGGVILTSADCVIWQRIPSGTSGNLRALARGAGDWVTAGDGVVLHSPDRGTWTAGTLPAGAVVEKVMWAFSRWIAAGSRNGTGLLLASNDGLTWTETTPAGLGPGTITGLASDGVKVVAVGGDTNPGGPRSDILSSPNGLVWTVQSGATRPLVEIVYADSVWYAAGEEEVSSSPDAVAWTYRYGSGFIQFKLAGLSAADGLLTFAGAGGAIFDSLIPVTAFTRRGGNAVITYGTEPEFFASLGPLVVAAGEFGIQYVSHDSGQTWQGGAYVVSGGISGLAAGAGRIVRSHYGGVDHTSDGVTWTRVDMTYPSVPAKGLVFGNGRFVSARQFNGFFVSTTGTAWNVVSTTTPLAIALTFGNGVFMSLDESGNVRTSADGAGWSAVISTVNASRLHFAHDRFFALNGDHVRSSTDGAAWQTINGLPAGVEFTGVLWHRDRYVIIGGPDGLLFTSPDLVTWTRIPVPASGMIRGALSHDAGLFVTGDNHAILLAPDTTPATPPAGQITLTSGGLLAPNVIGFTITGTAGQVVTLQRSPDLNTWTDVQTFTLSGGAELLEVQIPALLPSDYFRLRWTP